MSAAKRLRPLARTTSTLGWRWRWMVISWADRRASPCRTGRRSDHVEEALAARAHLIGTQLVGRALRAGDLRRRWNFEAKRKQQPAASQTANIGNDGEGLFPLEIVQAKAGDHAGRLRSARQRTAQVVPRQDCARCAARARRQPLVREFRGDGAIAARSAGRRLSRPSPQPSSGIGAAEGRTDAAEPPARP